MRLMLTDRKCLAPAADAPVNGKPGWIFLRVLCCAICRTDAKMWHEGHRDLVLPRVPGHEFTAVDKTGRRYTVWPGAACGQCAHCRAGRENLCDEMKITGFHNDGGFADHVLVPAFSLVPIPHDVSDHLGCFAEPVGCAFHALEKLNPVPGQRLLVTGGGTLGLITALVARSLGVDPLVIEKNRTKIWKSRSFLEHTGIPCTEKTDQDGFDLAVNACSDIAAFNFCIERLEKNGRMSFFSGLNKKGALESDRINLLHYREIALFGTYGLNRRDIIAGVDFIRKNAAALELLVEALVSPRSVSQIIEHVLDGRGFKYIIDFRTAWQTG